MNKIIVNGDEVTLNTNSSLNINVIKKEDIFDITKIEINVLKNTSLIVEYNNTLETKLDICIKVNKNVSFKLYELRCEDKIKVQYKYYLEENSNILVNKFYNCIYFSYNFFVSGFHFCK